MAWPWAARDELFGLIGPDGAGKTTTLRLLVSLLAVTSGQASVAGCDLRRQADAVFDKLRAGQADFTRETCKPGSSGRRRCMRWS